MSLNPNITLDPQGFRGTSTARRARQSRQRRQLRTLLFALALLVAGGVLVWLGVQPRDVSLNVVSAHQLPIELNEPATLDATGNLWLASQSGALWRVGTDGQSERYGMATPSGAPPFISEGGGIYVPGLDGVLTAYSTPGKAQWSRDLGAALVTSPALWRVGDAKILASGDSDGRVVGLNATDGKTLWSAQLGGPIGNALTATRDGFVAPTLANGVWRGGLVGLNGKSGEVRWRAPQNGKLSPGVAAPVFDADSNRVYWNNDESSVFCFDASSGGLIWETEVAPAEAPLGVMLRARPVLRGQNLLVGGNDGILRSLDVNNGKALWQTNLKSPIRVLNAANVGGNPAILAVSEREIVLVNADKGEIIGRDKGEMAWPLGDEKGAIVVGESGSWRRVSW